ncbi:MAG: hypothetical protein CME70_09055 [Halobacteriovorax sp.]|nr:hypothetical protein [Halobacteriovorax sp.]|tara:strand:+ start:33055 stop:33762 length:708 start_codon:yes stop_codon:yes gene_type:complete
MIQVVLPMAGEGLRFQTDYPNSYKPFIEIDGKYLFQYALDSLNTIENLELIFILRHEDVDHYAKIVKNEYPDAKIVILKSKTRGASETVLKASEHLSPNEKLLILDSDLTFESPDFLEFIKNSNDNENGFATFNSSLQRFSYCQHVDGAVLRVAEKEVISDRAIIGAYFFGSTSRFLNLAKGAISNEVPNVGEYYISPLYNKILELGQKVFCFEAASYSSLGTPEEIQEFLKKKS